MNFLFLVPCGHPEKVPFGVVKIALLAKGGGDILESGVDLNSMQFSVFWKGTGTSVILSRGFPSGFWEEKPTIDNYAFFGRTKNKIII